MEMISTTAAAVCLATLLMFIFILRRQRKSPNLPPGPKPWPIIGNLNLMGPLPHRDIHRLSTQYGPLMHLQFGSIPVVVGSSVEMAELMLKTMDVNFADRPNNAAGKYTMYNYSDMAWSPYGPYWRQARKIFLTEILSAHRVKSYEFIRVEEMKSFLRETFESCGNPVFLNARVANFGLNVVSRMVLGKIYTVESEEKSIVSPNEYRQMVDDWFTLNGVLNIGDYIPWLGFLDLQGYVKKMKILSKNTDRFLEHVLDEHEQRRNTDPENKRTKDMVDVLLDVANDPTLEVKVDRNGVKAFTLNLINGGTGSAIIVEWAFAELVKNPQLFEKAHDELDRVIGPDRWVEEEDMPNLPYITAIMKETMRLHAAPMTAARMSREDCTINGYDIKKGTTIFVSAWSIHRDPKNWENPEEFLPDRFLDKNIDVFGKDFVLLPFGSGRRMCPGYNLGLKMLHSSLANLLHGFKWNLPSDICSEDLNMDEAFGLSTPKKIPLVVVAEPRLPLHLYESL